MRGRSMKTQETLGLRWQRTRPTGPGTWRLEQADALGGLRRITPATMDAIVTDPPYGIAFMDRGWDRFDEAADGTEGRRLQAWTTRWAERARTAVKPGALWLVFGSPRTVHRTACGLEDAGLRIVDQLLWLYGEGFPKSVELAEGIGTGLKPAYEPILIAQLPPRGTATATHARHRTGGFNIDDCLIEGDRGSGYWSGDDRSDRTSRPGYEGGFSRGGSKRDGRWPPNVALDPAAAAMLDQAGGTRTSGGAPTRRHSPVHSPRVYRGSFSGEQQCPPGRRRSSGGPSRFFYCAKASESDRNAGLDPGADNGHPCLKPTALMRWLVRLATPPGGHVLDPFAGSGSTGVACLLEHRSFTGIEREGEYASTARARLAGTARMPEEWSSGKRGAEWRRRSGR